MANNVEVQDEKLNVDDIINALGDDDANEKVADETENKKEVKAKKDDKEDEESDKEEKELDKEEEEEDEPLLEEDKYYDVPNRKAILKAFPEIFKTFPGIEHALYKEDQYSKLFATPKDAEEQLEELKSLKEFEEQVTDGSLETVLGKVKEDNPEAFDKITGSYLQTLFKVAPEAYYSTLNGVWQIAIYNMFMQGKQAGGEDGEQQQIAAQMIHKWMFGNADIKVPRMPGQQQQPDENKKKLDEERSAYDERRFNDALDDVTSRCDNKIKSAVELNIDRKEQMTLYVRTNAVKDVMSKVEDEVENDTRFRAHLDKLWIESKKDNYSRASKEKITSAILSKTKSVLPDIIRKVKADALKGSSTRIVEDEKDNKEEKSTTKRTTANDERRERKTSDNDRKPNRKMSTLDFLNS